MKRLKDIPERHRIVAHAWFIGQEIQFSDRDDPDQWFDIESPSFYEYQNYRIKPDQFPTNGS